MDNEERIELIEEIIPEIVHNRCFCDPGSREFIELDSVSIDKVSEGSSEVNDKKCELLRGKIVIKFSSEPKTFFVIIKLLSQQAAEDDEDYKYFANEEMFYNKMTLEYKLDIYPKLYVADMGRYGRPIIVIEDLQAVSGYRCVHSKLDEDHLRMCLKAIARFHGRGLRLKCNKFNTFREFYAKLLHTNNISDYSLHVNLTNKVTQYLDEHLNVDRKILKLFEEFQQESANKDNEFLTICNGSVDLNNLLFRYENSKPTDIKIINWGAMRYSSPVIDWQIIVSSQIGENLSNVDIQRLLYDYLTVLVEECPGIIDNVK
ncbi:uncharacterized protein LOC123258458 isoform X2 [Cotesia glomerata]|nr:uncharacterized protein LOC123258458 isoform X2 [Cotesia glomerata]XP_044574396.1 uncharacterized protein LOC123258458 isoform X2 [Cotesia glomerata]XP_044574397.1 uncharacterized protein LOC123258458 isoform X2 [Cotesia glomerata]